MFHVTNKIRWLRLLPCRSSRTVARTRDCFPSVEQNLARQTEEGSQEDCLPFIWDDDSNVPGESPPVSSKRDSNIPNYRRSFDTDVGKGSCSTSNSMDIASRNTSVQKMEKDVSRHEDHRTSAGFLKELMRADEKPLKPSSKGFMSDLVNFVNFSSTLQILSFTFLLFACTLQLWIRWSFLIRIMFLCRGLPWRCHLHQQVHLGHAALRANQEIHPTHL